MAGKQKRKENNFMIQGSILAIAGVITKIIGAVYRIPLMNIVGDEGMGYYNVAFSIYTVALTLTSYSLPLAVSKLVSARVAVGQYKNAYKVLKGAFTFALLSGGFVALLIFFGAEFIASTIMSMDMSVYALRILAPCILVVALLGVLRGFFQGNGSMVPTAVSQILEQIVNAVASIAGAYILLQVGKGLAETRGNDSFGPAYAAAGGTVGTIAGAFFALLFIALLASAYLKVFKRKMRRDRSRKRESYQLVYRVLFVTIAPVILSATVSNISDFVDNALFNNIMAAQGYGKTEYASLLGILGGQYTTMINVPLSVATALGSSLIPSLVATVQTGSRKQIHHKITSVIRFNMCIAIPCAMGLDNDVAARMLQLGAISVVFFCLSTVTTSVLQGLDDMITPVKNSAIALVIHVVSLLLMMVVFEWNIYAVVLSKIVFAGALCILNAHALRERISYVQEQRQTFVIPAAASAVMGIVALVVHLLIELFVGEYVATVIAILVAIVVYGAALVLFGGVSEEELLDMPKGATLVTLCRKLHLIRGEYR